MFPFPTGSALPALPLTWRPRRTRLVAYSVAAAVMAVMATIAILLPPSEQHGFGWFDRLAFIVLGLGVGSVLHLLARPRLMADRTGLTVVNMFRTRRLTWPEVVHVNLRRGDPWVFLDLDDGDTLPVMGIQASDGERARAQAMQLRQLVAELTRTERND